VIDAALRALDQPLTQRELAERVSQSLGSSMRAMRGGGWGNRSRISGVEVGSLTLPAGYVLHLASARGVVCYGPSRGNEPTFVRADAWIPRWRDVPSERAEAELLRRYLRAFGPATPTDFALWTGMTLADAREIWTRVEAEIAPLSVDGWGAALLRDDLIELQAAALEQPSVRLLPYFDSFLLGHKDRQHLVATRDRNSIYRAQGWVAPVVLADGRAVGVWAHARQAKRLSVRVTQFAPLSRRVAAGIRDEARDFGRFLGAPDVEVQIA